MITEIDASLLEKIADLTGKPVGAFNIRKDGGCEARQSTEHITIDPQPEGKSGIIIRIRSPNLLAVALRPIHSGFASWCLLRNGYHRGSEDGKADTY